MPCGTYHIIYYAQKIGPTIDTLFPTGIPTSLYQLPFNFLSIMKVIFAPSLAQKMKLTFSDMISSNSISTQKMSYDACLESVQSLRAFCPAGKIEWLSK